MTQLLQPNAKRGVNNDHSEPKHLECDAERGSGRFDYLYATNPRLNRCNPAFLSPDELKSKGFRDGVAGVRSQNLGHDPHYNNGWILGYADRQRQQIIADGLSIVWTSTDLSEVLDRVPQWSGLAQWNEFVEVRSLTDTHEYLLCVSTSLLDRDLPF
jgi:hypothetical protein